MKNVTRIVEGVQYKLIKEGFEPVYLFNPDVDELVYFANEGFELEIKLEGKFNIIPIEK